MFAVPNNLQMRKNCECICCNDLIIVTTIDGLDYCVIRFYKCLFQMKHVNCWSNYWECAVLNYFALIFYSVMCTHILQLILTVCSIILPCLSIQLLCVCKINENCYFFVLIFKIAKLNVSHARVFAKAKELLKILMTLNHGRKSTRTHALWSPFVFIAKDSTGASCGDVGTPCNRRSA